MYLLLFHIMCGLKKEIALEIEKIVETSFLNKREE